IYSDRALITHVSSASRQGSGVPISSSSQPSLMAQMLEDLRLMSGLQVLEIGSGTGFNAALLVFVISPGEVVSVDVARGVVSGSCFHRARDGMQRRIPGTSDAGGVRYASARGGRTGRGRGLPLASNRRDAHRAGPLGRLVRSQTAAG